MSVLNDEYTNLYQQNNYTVLDKIKSYPNETLDYFIPTEAAIYIPNKIPKFNKINFLFGSYDSGYYDFYKSIGDVYFFPFYWAYPLINKIENTKINYDFRHLGICMNFWPKMHRRLLMQEINSHNLLSKIKYSWKSTYKNPKIFEFETETSVLSDNISEDNNFEIEWKIPLEYHTTFIDIVNETFNEIGFITEKTLKPILLGKPFLVNSVPGFHHKLEKFGFKLYHTLFDYKFDHMLNQDWRIEELVKQISKLDGADYNKLYESILPDIRHNQLRLLNIIKNYEFVPDILSKSSFNNSKQILDNIKVLDIDSKIKNLLI